MRFRRSENELPPLSRSLLPAGHAGKDETRHAFLGAAHAALLSPEGDRSLARGDLRTMIVCHGPADKPGAGPRPLSPASGHERRK